MRFPMTTRALRGLAMLAAVSLVTTACGDDDPVEVEPNTTRIVLTVGTGAGAQTLTWNTQNASVAPTEITIPAGQSRTVTAQFLRADNSTDPVINADDFRLDFVITGSAVTVAKTSNLAATLTAGSTAAQSVTMIMQLVHLEEGHNEYVSNAVTVRVTAP